jgi:chromosome segregation ATPase
VWYDEVMRLKRLELFGFKSFGKKAVLDFTAQITAVVGPNGSGKSNIAESIRFVLGEQSMKSMRGKRGEDMIFNGSQTAGRANRANVTIVFDNTEREFALDFDEVAVSREVYRDGTNQYFINGSQVRLKDVFELLAAVHIGASGHHMISQGEADRILNANPKERREMLEDALGLKVYQYKRAESERRLEKTEENMKEAEALRREIAPHIKFLKKQVEKIKEAQDLRERLMGLYREYLKREEMYIVNRKRELDDKRHAPAQLLSDLNIKIAHARTSLEGEHAGDEKSGRLLSVESRLRDVRLRHDELSRSVGRLEGMIEYEEKQLRKKEEAIKTGIDISVRLADVEGLESVLGAQCDEALLSPHIDTVKRALSQMRDGVRNFIAEHRSRAGVRSLTDADYLEVHLMKEEKVKVESALALVLEESRATEEEYRVVKREIDEEKEQSRETERALFTMMSERGQVESQLDRLRMEEEALLRESRRLEEEVAEAGVLLGRAVMDYAHIPLTLDEVMAEPRTTQESRRRDIERGKIRLEDLGGQGSEDVEKEYQDTLDRDAFLEREIGDLVETRASLLALIVELNEKLDTEFKAGVKKINKQFSDFFTLMFGGGVAELFVVKIEKKKRKDADIDLSDMGLDMEGDTEAGEDEEGIDISVSLPHKKTKGLQMLSGGERALTSIALLFAISQVNPPPFMVLDETDAALDEANSRKYGDMIENLAKLSQLMVITHNRETMSRAGVLYGITMGNDAVSKVLSISFAEAEAVAK